MKASLERTRSCLSQSVDYSSEKGIGEERKPEEQFLNRGSGGDEQEERLYRLLLRRQSES